MAIYKPAYLPEFYDQVKKYRHLKKLIERKIRLLCQDPYHACKSESLMGPLKGLRSARITYSLRIVFLVAEEAKSPLNMPSKTIIFHTLGTHAEAYGR